ncbi:MAG: hypothetical protein JSS11_00235 [Verrucomicrobia bacterium]|nr:hypothetical protein [Verrucomicrobiota bacterium]
MKKLLLCLCLVASLCSLHAAPATMPAELIERAVRLKAPRWKFVDKAVMREIPETFALQVTAVAAFQEPDRVVEGKTLATHLAEKLRYILVTPRPSPQKDGSTNEPESLGGIGGWTHHVPAHVLLLAKRTPAVWSQLSADEKGRADLLMQALALAAHFCLDDDNDYYVRLDGASLNHKSWNPNIAEGYADIIVVASLYFGADELNAFFKSFDFDKFIARLEAANFQNIKRGWTWTPAIKGLMMNGGSIAVPSDALLAQGILSHGAGVRNDFTLNGDSLHEPWLIFRGQALRMFSKVVRTRVEVGDGPVTTSRLLHDASNAETSPWEGQMGMFCEFESSDWNGMRTSLQYAYEGSMIIIPTAVTLKLVGAWDDKRGGDVIERRMGVGMSDLIFKAREGYMSYSQAKFYETHFDKNLAPMGADFIFGLWKTYFAAPAKP